MTDALRTVDAHLTATEQLVDRYTAAAARVKLNGFDEDGVDQLRLQVDDAVLMVVTEWEAIGRPDDLADRIHALPGAHQATIEAAVDQASTEAFDTLVATDTWRPRPLDAHATPPPFPVDALPNWCQEHAGYVAEQIQVPVDLVAMLIIGSLSAACTGRAKVKISANWSEPVNLYLVTAMDSGAGKSAAEKLTCQWLRDWQKARIDAVYDDWHLAHRVYQVAEGRVKEVQTGMKRGSQTQDDLIHALRELDEAKDRVPELPRLIADDATPEAVATLLAAHGERLAIMSTEADLFDLVLRGKQGTRVNFNVYLKAWSGDPMVRDRKGGTESGPEMTLLSEPLMTVACTVQPSVLARLHNDEEMASRGFSARFMASLPESLVGRRDQSRRFSDTVIPTTEVYAKTATTLADEWAKWTMAEVAVDKAAQALLEAFTVEIEPELASGARYEHVKEWTSKLYGSVARYAGLLWLAEGNAPAAPMDATVMQRAIDLGRYWLATADIILGMGDEIAEQARAIKAWFDRADVATFKVRDLQRNVQRKSLGLEQATDFVPALELLVEYGWLTPSDADWATKVGVSKQSAGNFSVWSSPLEKPLSASYVGNVGCRTMGERVLFSSPPDTSTGGPLPTSRHSRHVVDNSAPHTDPDYDPASEF